ncbi:pyridoxal phosphate-dependent aminotransferase [Lentzea sp. NBRC 105346]|uniref:DegT/DnrJ/EryC1/StrS family aminotransferase n=1 Tax=Lentzea sp. NBRC 105346 TaxID=3032205 RepID=UPI0024A078B0|nr:DegT/DnrJ/EryC1/StrS family aminotransferase [Lentzea sp. NBRC 105346]GLZ35191.1 pyridoxal phosphate-dependent aminotransferase [Lentzea sp. NBRC 105346]
MSTLAVLGGPQIAPQGVDETRWPVVEPADVQAVTDTLLSGQLSWMNDTRVPALERQWADYVGADHCLAVNSGTAALHAAVAAAGVGPGDEVLVPALSFLASASCVLHHQGVPVFVDVDPRTFTIDPTQLAQHLTDRTKAIIAVHLHGLPADMDPIRQFARQHDLVVIEDAAQAHAATYNGKRTGSLGDLAAFSIMAGKNLATAGEGGLLTTSSADLRNRADAVKMFGETVGADGHRDYNAHTMGWNYRLSGVVAAFTSTQIERLDGYTAQVQEGARALTKALADVPGVVPPYVPDDRTHVYHHFRVLLDGSVAGLPDGVFRQAVHDSLLAEGIPVGEYQTRPLPGQTLFQQRIGYGGGCPWTCGKSTRSYRQEDYPATLQVIRSSLVVGKRLCMASFRDPDSVERYRDAFTKVLSNIDELREYASTIDYVEPWQRESRLW